MFLKQSIRRVSAMAVLLAASQVFGQFEINWYSVDGGGAMSSTGGTFSLDGTIGQPDAQTPPVMSGGTFQLTGGFWPAANACYCLADMNGDGKKDGRDVQKFVGCLLTAGDCSCADVDQAGGVAFGDVSVFVDDLVANGTCP